MKRFVKAPEEPNVVKYAFEHADKILIFTTLYLFISTALYNLGYWGHLSFDIYNYSSFYDLIKGIGSALQYRLLVAVIIITFILAIRFILYKNNKLKTPYTYFPNSILIIAAIFIAFRQYLVIRWNATCEGIGTLFDIKDSKIDYPSLQILLSLFTIYSISYHLAKNRRSSKEEYNKHRIGIYTFFYFILIYIPVLSLTEGIINAINISKSYKYDYIITKEYPSIKTVHTNGILKYVGKISNFHMFLDSLDNRIIIPQDSLAIITLYRHNIIDIKCND